MKRMYISAFDVLEGASTIEIGMICVQRAKAAL